ncbi:BtpA/SgcQ family protein [Pyrococcus abyssi]|uniref:Uncharacterized protein PYRAB10620 n=1 Tax=Pyrococcus abyssi (strain GE5 / Orsay) TaxID=272844 RepID=Y1062_PYRAB|nr:BtpA/SgcQ family protein [Pyrococcus abyssi]Q9UZT4.1 RecName: Full=Uncharacterized protein PYRAB10620 [Pyrococcus abyssi GE5]CAB49972.1 Membrane protein, BtpA family [Pyrococcus abyssi GE5]CCE70472.1 TPA: hypothetical protein PAB1665 [Pyrococcus abyssi GE5]
MDLGSKPLIGVVHLLPLPGSPGYRGSIEEILDRAISDAAKYQEAGFDAIILENYGDFPYSKTISKETLASFAVIAKEVGREISIPIGINVLRNDCVASYSIAYSVRADFIRVNVLTGVAFTDQGIIEGCARELAELRARLPSRIKVLADVHVKHATHFSSFEVALLDTVERGGADAVIITGSRTGSEVDIQELMLAKKISPVPVIVGSGLNPRNIRLFWRYADGFIVGTWVKEGGKTLNEVSLERATRIAKVVKSLRGE